MSLESTAGVSPNTIRTTLIIGGILAVVVGVLILVWPGISAVILTILIGIYAVIAGLVYGVSGIVTKGLGGWARTGHIVLGIVFIVAGILILLSPLWAAAWLALFLTILIGIAWIVESIIALTLIADASSKTWTIIFSILGIIAGILILTSPLWAALWLWLLLGIAFIVLGIVQFVRGITYGRRAAAGTATATA